MSAGWSVTVEFSAATPDDAERLRAIIEAMAQASNGISDVAIDAEAPERWVRINASGEPGAVGWLDLGPVYVIGPLVAARRWAYEHGLGAGDWHHVGGAASLYGARGRYVLLDAPVRDAETSAALRSVLEQGRASGALVEFGA